MESFNTNRKNICTPPEQAGAFQGGEVQTIFLICATAMCKMKNESGYKYKKNKKVKKDEMP
ncbi:MAG: hypothetical protein KJ886_02145 [Candidatus Thermoplasmatota archaeon]|nr:hypothetical protein [Candidatus Thermoplasmatota archaeon]